MPKDGNRYWDVFVPVYEGNDCTAAIRPDSHRGLCEYSHHGNVRSTEPHYYWQRPLSRCLKEYGGGGPSVWAVLSTTLPGLVE